MSKILIEVIAWSVEDAKRIEAAGADRIELVVNLEEGGLTPPMELVNDVCNAVNIPVNVMVRDTSRSFVYTEAEMDSHIAYIEKLKETKANGIVFGSINENNELDLHNLKRVIDAKGDLEFAHHRAFDSTNNPIVEFKKLAKFDCVDILLTSGTKKSALEGIEIINELVSLDTHINILAGSGVSLANCKELVRRGNVKQLHVGLAIREDGTINSEISIEKIQQIIEEVK